jgi:hypothetical protein
VSGWGDYGACNASTGKKSRTRTVTQEKKNSGAACPALSEEADCNTQACAIPWKGSCSAHKTDFGSGTFTVETFDQYVKNQWTVGFYVSSKDEYCRYGREQLIEGRTAGWATLDPCCVSDVNFSGRTRGTDGRCGPGFNNTACGGKACCSQFGWCGGETGTTSDWCAVDNRGVNNGEFDGEKRPSLASAFWWRLSDIRLKTNLRKTGRKIATLDEYTWDWNEIAKEIGVSSDPTTGVIAQEAMIVYPDVVSTGAHGYFMVNYGRLRAIKE